MGSPEGIQYGKAFEVQSAVETTLAGDLLIALVIVGILEKMKIIQLT